MFLNAIATAKYAVKLTKTNLNIDHIIALARGGQNDISNLQTLCSA